MMSPSRRGSAISIGEAARLATLTAVEIAAGRICDPSRRKAFLARQYEAGLISGDDLSRIIRLHRLEAE